MNRIQEKVSINAWVPKEVRLAYDNAAEELHMQKQQIIKEALEMWLIANRFLDPDDKTAI